jgi:hypothetical protein
MGFSQTAPLRTVCDPAARAMKADFIFRVRPKSAPLRAGVCENRYSVRASH